MPVVKKREAPRRVSRAPKVRILVPDFTTKRRSSSIAVWPRVVAWQDKIYSVRCGTCGSAAFFRHGELKGAGIICGACKRSTTTLFDTGKMGWWAFVVSSASFLPGGAMRLDKAKGPYSDMADAIIDFSRDLGLISSGPVALA